MPFFQCYPLKCRHWGTHHCSRSNNLWGKCTGPALIVSILAWSSYHLDRTTHRLRNLALSHIGRCCRGLHCTNEGPSWQRGWTHRRGRYPHWRNQGAIESRLKWVFSYLIGIKRIKKWMPTVSKLTGNDIDRLEGPEYSDYTQGFKLNWAKC